MDFSYNECEYIHCWGAIYSKFLILTMVAMETIFRDKGFNGYIFHGVFNDHVADTDLPIGALRL